MKLSILRGFQRVLVFCLTIIIIIGFCFTGIVFGKSLNIGFVDMNQLQTELPYYQELEDTLNEKNVELESFRGILYKQYLQFYQENAEKYEKQKTGKSIEEQQQLTERFQAEVNSTMAQLNEQLEKRQNELQAFKEEQNRILIDKVDKLINSVSAKKKLAVVIEKKYMFYGGTDITKDIIKKAQKDQKRKKP